MTVETVVGNIDLSADKPFGKRFTPFENCVPFLEPVKLLSLFRPKTFGVGFSLGVKPFVFLKTLNVSICGKLCWRRKDTGFTQDRFDIDGIKHDLSIS